MGDEVIAKPAPDSVDWWREVAEGLGVKCFTLTAELTSLRTAVKEVRALQRYVCGPRGMIPVTPVVDDGGGYVRVSDVEPLVTSLRTAREMAEQRVKELEETLAAVRVAAASITRSLIIAHGDECKRLHAENDVLQKQIQDLSRPPTPC